MGQSAWLTNSGFRNQHSGDDPPHPSARNSITSDADSSYDSSEFEEYSDTEAAEGEFSQLEAIADEFLKRQAFLQTAQVYDIQDEYFTIDVPMEETSIDDDYYSMDEVPSGGKKTIVIAARSESDTSAIFSNPGFKWQRGALIGSGSFGKVYLGLNLQTGEFMAVKQVELMQEQLEQHKADVANLQNEISVLRNLKHENIVQYLGSSVEGPNFNIFLEYVSGGSLSSLVRKFGPMPENLIRVYTRQILTGLHYLHSNEIIHRDIKGANILVDNKGVIKLADFGASKKLEGIVVQATESVPSLKGTVYWMAPEVIKQSGYGRQADIWSVGCTVIELATGKPPWSSLFDDQISALFTIATSDDLPSFPEPFSDEAKDFLTQCFKRNPKERPNATKLLHHTWMAANAAPRRHNRSRPGSVTYSGTFNSGSLSTRDTLDITPEEEDANGNQSITPTEEQPELEVESAQ